MRGCGSGRRAAPGEADAWARPRTGPSVGRLLLAAGVVVGLVGGVVAPRVSASVLGLGNGGLPSLGGLPSTPFGVTGCASLGLACGPFNDQPSMQSLSAHVIAGLAWSAGLVWSAGSDLLAGLARVWNDSSLPADVVSYIQGLEQQVLSLGGVFDPSTPPSDITSLWSALLPPATGSISNSWTIGTTVAPLSDTTEAVSSSLMGPGAEVLLAPQGVQSWNDGAGNVYAWVTGCWNGGTIDEPNSGASCTAGAGVEAGSLQAAGSEATIVLDYMGSTSALVDVAYTGSTGSAETCTMQVAQWGSLGSDGWVDGNGDGATVYSESVSSMLSSACNQSPLPAPNWADPVTVTVGNMVGDAIYQSTSQDTFETAVVGVGLTNSSCTSAAACPLDVSAQTGLPYAPQAGLQLAPGVSSPAVPVGQQVAAPLDPAALSGSNVAQPMVAQTVTGSTVPVVGNVPSQVPIVGPLLTGIQNLFEVDTQEQVGLEQQVQSVEATASTAFPFSWWSSFLNTADTFFAGAGSTCPSVSWSYSLSGASFGTETIPLCDAFGLMGTVRTISSFVIYGFLLAWGFLEVRAWFRSGGTD